ncbi:DUF11 domain-containing protein [Candidatus Entotheonella palauensis]|uniref:DUF11 domain-containing protein n=1 Tax=Candidatus Entotheonella palauensis TaxID=93172 RepID=UPI001177FD38|nr:DUF11 domain-containing protein [Candidatus Entotheonella palauensis]
MRIPIGTNGFSRTSPTLPVDSGSRCGTSSCVPRNLAQWTFPTLGPEESRTIQLRSRVTQEIGFGTLIPTHFEASYEGAPALVKTAATVAVERIVTPWAFHIAVHGEPSPLPASGEQTYTVSFTNSGRNQATGVLVELVLPEDVMVLSHGDDGVSSGTTVQWEIEALGNGSGDRRREIGLQQLGEVFGKACGLEIK